MSKTQIEAARAGEVTPEMELVARAEHLEAECVRQEVAAGRLVIPANRVHLARGLQPLGIGVAVRCKINANIGNSAVTGDETIELEKLHTALHFGADTVMDLSTGKDIDRIRQLIIDTSPVPVGTVPIYQMLEELGGDIEDMRPQHFLDMVEHQAQQGVDYMTIHCGLLLEHLPNRKLTLLIGGYAQEHYLGSTVKPTLTETVRAWKEFQPDCIPLPHPSFRNLRWLKLNPWFESEVIPFLRKTVHALLKG